MTDTVALDQAVRENLDIIRKSLAKTWAEPCEWHDGVGFVHIYIITLIRVSYRRIAAKRANAEEQPDT